MLRKHGPLPNPTTAVAVWIELLPLFAGSAYGGGVAVLYMRAMTMG